MTRPSRSRTPSGRRDCGSGTAFLALVAVALMALAGLAIDGGRALEARQAAAAEAEQAARAGASALSSGGLRQGDLVIDVPRAIAAAESFADSTGHPGTALVVGSTVVVTVEYRLPTDVLGIIGIHSFRITGHASATDLIGIANGGSS